MEKTRQLDINANDLLIGYNITTNQFVLQKRIPTGRW